ncbi:YybH family protein [Nodosilinea sp. AN01ver1]|uniref:YybH family protein n=1 Tax=Nodosilinea sp. AN01ver1 TaxID=3423362 RepID=UPI003D319210
MLTLPTDDLDAIGHIHRRWIELELAGNGLEVLQFCTDDVRWLVPNAEMIVGKDAACSLLESDVQIVELTTEQVEITGHGRLAYKTSRYTTRFVSPESGEILAASGTHLWILHKQPDAQWKVALVTWQPAS